MTYVINGKEYSEFDINERCAEIMRLDVAESVMQLGSVCIPTGIGLVDENFNPYNPCQNPQDTCLFASVQRNAEKANAKNYKFISPQGVEVSIFNMAKFCRENMLNFKSMSKVHLGQRGHHKNWRAA